MKLPLEQRVKMAAAAKHMNRLRATIPNVSIIQAFQFSTKVLNFGHVVQNEQRTLLHSWIKRVVHMTNTNGSQTWVFEFHLCALAELVQYQFYTFICKNNLFSRRMNMKRSNVVTIGIKLHRMWSLPFMRNCIIMKKVTSKSIPFVWMCVLCSRSKIMLNSSLI